MKRIILLSFLLSTFLVMDLLAQDGTWVINGQVRHRYSMDGRDFNGDTGTLNMNELRTRLGIKFMPSEDITGFVQIQDARIMGTETSTLFDGSADALDAHQAYAQITNLFDMPLTMKVGRMEVALGNQRLIGSVGWHNIGRSFDGLVFTYAQNGTAIHFFNLKAAEAFAPGDVGDVEAMGAWADFNVDENTRVQGYGIWDRVVGSGAHSRITLGTQVDVKMGNLSGTGEFAYQTGQANSTTDFAAMMFAVNGTMNMNGTALSAGVDYLSGQDDSDDATAFQTLFATNHKFYGMMDYFLNNASHTGYNGLMDIHVKASMKVDDKTKVSGAFHNLNFVEKFAGETELGNEIDLVVNHKYNKVVTFQGGFGYFLQGKLFESPGAKDNSTFLYLMTIVNLN